MAHSAESLNDIVSRIVLQHNMVEEDRLDAALELQREILDTEGKRQSLERVLLDMGILRGKQLKGLRYAIIYYLVRKADRFYGKIATQSDICEMQWVKEALREQKRIHQNEHRLVRVNKILLEKGYINAREDRAILRAIEGIRERRRKQKPGGKRSKKGKAKKKSARVERPSDDEMADDLSDLGSLDELSANEVDETVGIRDDDPQSLEEFEELSGIADFEDPGEVVVDDVSEVDQGELLQNTSSVEDIDPDDELDAGSEEEPGAGSGDVAALSDALDAEDDLDGDLDLDGSDLDLDGADLDLDGADLDLDGSDLDVGSAGSGSAAAEDDLEASDEDDLEASDEDDLEASDEDDLEASGEDDLEASGEDDLEASDEDDLEASDEDDLEASDEDDAESSDEDDLEASDEDDAESSDEDDLEASDEDDAESSDEDDLEASDEDDAESSDEDDLEASDEDDAETSDDGSDEAVGNREKGGFFARFRRKQTPPPRLRSKKAVPSKGAIAKKKLGAGKPKAPAAKKKASGKSSKVTGRTGKKIDTARLAEMAKKNRAKRFGR